MDKEFWATLAKNDYAVPAGHTLSELKETLFGYLGSIDPELRDDIAYIVYANWLKREMFTKDEVRAQVDELLANLDKGIGETESDSVSPMPLFKFASNSSTCARTSSFVNISRLSQLA